jgi:SAM-dependent methyltransferase
MTIYNRTYFKDLKNAAATEIPRNLRNIKLIERHSSRSRGLKILDVGVGVGHFINLALKKGWIIDGTDVSKYALDYVKKKYGIKVFMGGLNAKADMKKTYDVINMRHTIEHLKIPSQDLKSAYNLLHKNGLLCVSTPNSYGPHSMFYGKDWPHLSKPYHLHFYSKQSLKKIIIEAGFSIIECKTEELSIYDILRYLLFKLGIPINYKVAPCLPSRLIDRFFALAGWGEGILLVARKNP